MFEIDKSMVITIQEKLLYNIYEQNKLILDELQKNNTSSLLQPVHDDTVKNLEYENLKRCKLIAEVKKLPEKPKNWTKLKNIELIKLLQKE